MTYDLIIIGGGPAGVAAAVYASRKRLQTLFITTEWGGQSIVSEQIYNWIGTNSLSGNELAENFKKHVLANVGEGQTLKVKEGEKVVSVAEALLPPAGGSRASATLTTFSPSLTFNVCPSPTFASTCFLKFSASSLPDREFVPIQL